MDPITLALLGTAGAKAIGGIAQGVGAARAARKMQLTPAEQDELDRLERDKAAGNLGLSERQREGLAQQFLAQQAGAQRQLEATGLQQAAARGLSGGVSGRELFLAQQAGAAAQMGVRQERNAQIEALNQQQIEADKARIDALRAQEKGAEAQRAQGIAQAVSGGVLGAAQVGEAAVGMMQQTKLAEVEAAARAEATESLLNRYGAPGAEAGYGFSAFAPAAPPARIR